MTRHVLKRGVPFRWGRFRSTSQGKIEKLDWALVCTDKLSHGKLLSHNYLMGHLADEIFEASKSNWRY